MHVAISIQHRTCGSWCTATTSWRSGAGRGGLGKGDARAIPCTSQTIGPEEWHSKELKVIGRYVRFAADGIEVEPDPKYLTQALEAYGLQESKAVATPAIKEDGLDAEGRK